MNVSFGSHSSLSGRWIAALALPALALPALALALAVTSGARAAPAGADGDPELTALAVSVMPEYDQPRVLVSYRGVFDPAVSFPLEAHLRLPLDAGIEHVCSISETEEHICQPYTTNPDGQYLAVTWEAITPVMYVEYYYGSVAGAGERDLDFTLMPPYPVEQLDLFVLEPSGAAEFTLSPEPVDTVADGGFRHHSYSFQSVSANEPVNIGMAYSRETDEPSAPPRNTPMGDGDGSAIPQAVLLSLTLVGAGVIAAVVIVMLARRARLRPRPAPVPSHADGGGSPPAAGLFCRSCGGRLRRGFLFCPDCGRQVRTASEEKA